MRDDERDRVELVAGIVRVLHALRPYLPDLVLIGGWVPYLHRRYGTIRRWEAALSFTRELDLLLPATSLALENRPPLAKLLAAAGLLPTNPATTAGAVIWVGPPERGDAIEFLVPHSGTFQSIGSIVPIIGQTGVAAVMLPGLSIMERHTIVLQIPLLDAGERTDEIPSEHHVVPVRVPRLGAYVVNKAITFSMRQPRRGERTNPKRGKDLLYLRDLMAAGAGVADAITSDVRHMLRTDTTAQFIIDAAVSNLDLVAAGSYAEAVELTATMLTEREPERTFGDATADVVGRITDLLELLRPFRSPEREQNEHDGDE
jgi:hypothetical protein